MFFALGCGKTPHSEPLLDAVTDVSTPTRQDLVTVKYTSELEGFLCVPEGQGPFPVVVYNHGGLGDALGGPPEETCLALRSAGYLGFAPIRRQEVPIAGHSDDVDAGIAYAKDHEKADATRVAVLGFSRGGYLTFLALT